MIYCYADIHGRIELMTAIYDAILTDIEKTGDQYNEIVQLGDVLDRGNNSRECIEFLMRLADTDHLKHINLLGNHEDFLLQAMDNFGTPAEHVIYRIWMENGGIQTLDSFGIMDYDKEAQNVFKPYYKWLKALPTWYEKHNYIFCHSGFIRTDFNIPLSAQRDNLLWGRHHKNMYVGYDKVIIHGHTPTDNGKPQVEINRINLDTGGWYSRNNWMHAVALPDREATEKDARFIKITV